MEHRLWLDARQVVVLTAPVWPDLAHKTFPLNTVGISLTCIVDDLAMHLDAVVFAKTS
jgi:hypothetical protein